MIGFRWAMEFYKSNLVVLVTTNAALAYWRYNNQKKPDDIDHEATKQEAGSAHGGPDAMSRFKSRFFAGYVLAVTSDWLQVGPPYHHKQSQRTSG